MSGPVFNFDDNSFTFPISDNMGMGSDGHLDMRVGNIMSMDLNTGQMHFNSGWDASNAWDSPGGSFDPADSNNHLWMGEEEYWHNNAMYDEAGRSGGSGFWAIYLTICLLGGFGAILYLLYIIFFC